MKIKHLSIILVTLFMCMSVFILLPVFADENSFTTKLDVPFQLKVDEKISLESENLQVKFLNVTADSRCPSDVQCIWQGEAKIFVNIIKNNKDLGDFSLISRSGSKDLAILTFDGYSIELLKIYPYPSSGNKIDLMDYVSTIVISKSNIPSSPLEQFRSGIAAKNVNCKQGLQLVIRSENTYPACVKQEHIDKFVQLGWIVVSSKENGPISLDHADSNNQFAFSLFSNILQKDNGNVFFSPYNISNALSMVYEGARGSTRDEIQSVFHFDPNDAIRRDSVKEISLKLNNSNNYQLSIANAMWIQNDFPVLKEYVNILQNYYFASATNMDFKTDAESSRHTINSWVENKTNQKILDLFSQGSITDTTRVVLANAIYFKGNWSNQFNENLTTNQDFHTMDQKTVTVKMMTIQHNFKYFEDDNLQVLEMPYKGDRLSMIILLPKQNNLGTLANSLSVDKLNQWNDKMTSELVSVYLPKIILNTKYVLNSNLASMGMPSAFLPDNSDFTGITGKKDLFISIIVHQAYLKVDEKGTEATAATGVGFQTTSMPLSMTFRADHPFVFLIRDNQTGIILFMGQIVDPSSK